jgi:hypothetical protein
MSLRREAREDPAQAAAQELHALLALVQVRRCRCPAVARRPPRDLSDCEPSEDEACSCLSCLIIVFLVAINDA